MSTVRDQEVSDAIGKLKHVLLELHCFGRLNPAEDLTPEKPSRLRLLALSPHALLRSLRTARGGSTASATDRSEGISPFWK